MRIAINGMGRIGRLLFRRIFEAGNLNIVAVNDIMPAANLSYLLKYDSVYGTFSGDINQSGNDFLIGDKSIKVFREADPSKLPWKELNIDVVLECSGVFLNRESVSRHLIAGAKKVLLSTTGKDDIPLKIFGFNQNGKNDDILSPGGCMTNCSTHILYLLNSFGIDSAMINILHSYTSRQSLVDTSHNQFRRGRAAAESIIPVDIDLYLSLERLMPVLTGKVHASSTRIPIPNGAYANFYVEMKSEISAKEVNKLFATSAKNDYKAILQYTEEPLVSLDIKGNTHSCIVDGSQTASTGTLVRVAAWFDNEYGFTSRMLDWLDYWNEE